MADSTFPFGQYVRDISVDYKTLINASIVVNSNSNKYTITPPGALSANSGYAVEIPTTYKKSVSAVITDTDSGTIELDKAMNTGVFTFYTNVAVSKIEIILEESIAVSSIYLYSLRNILLEPITKIGIQCKPHSLFCLNGEEIYIGRTGLYELNTSLTFVGAFTNENFVIDYKR